MALIPLGLGASIDDREMHNPIALLQAIRKLAGRLVVFCDAAAIKVPTSPSRLLSLLDEVIVPVSLPKKNGVIPSFHAKTWTLAYENAAGERKWRFVNLSRNLTMDQSWDVSVALDGRREKGTVPKTHPLADFLGHLEKLCGPRQKSIVGKLRDSLDRVSFVADAPFDDFEICPIGFGEPAPNIFHWNEPYDDRIVISPFLTPTLVKELNERASPDSGRKKQTNILISREDVLSSLKASQMDRFEKYILREVKDESGGLHDLHAKVYLWRRDSRTEFWLGSANATDSAFNRNVEMMVRLSCYNRHLNAKSLMEGICGNRESANPLEKIDDLPALALVDPLERARRQAEDLLREVVRLKMTARVESVGARYRYILTVEGGSLPTGVEVWPMNAPGCRCLLGARCEFVEPVELADLSSFFVVSVPYGSNKSARCVLPVKMEPGDLLSKRRDAVLDDVVRDRPSLLRYLLVLLSPNPSVPLKRLGAMEAEFARGNAREVVSRVLPGLYEEMLVAAAEDVDRIRDAGFVIGRLKDKDGELAEYAKVYQVFAEALKLDRKGARHG